MSAFERWMKQVDAFVVSLSGVGVYDLPDCAFYDWFEDGVSAKSAAKRALRNAGW